MRTRAGNLILASLALLVFVMGEAGCHSAVSLSPPHPHGPITIPEILMDAIVVFWFVGALGLFSRKRVAWVGSLVGVGASACFSLMSLAIVVGLSFFPNADMRRIPDPSGSGHIAAVIIGGGGFLVLLAVSVGLFLGLLQMRKELRK